jgi:hypothetical protein
MSEVVGLEELATWLEENKYLCDPNGGTPTPDEIARFTPVWKQAKGASFSIGTPQDDWIEFTQKTIKHGPAEYNTEIQFDGYLHTKSFQSDASGEGYSIWMPDDLAELEPSNGDFVGVALLWIPGGRNWYVGNCTWTTRGEQGPHIIFGFAEHGEFESNHPLPANYQGEIKVKWNLKYRINML